VIRRAVNRQVEAKSFAFTSRGGRIVTIDMIAGPEHLPRLEAMVL
jgi:hypothetical protein